jgi:uncharacterized protein (DUF433 family)
MSTNKGDFYGGTDPRHMPLYNMTEAARYLHLAPATLRSWVAGRSYPRKESQGYFAPLIERPEADDSRLSFMNLIEAHVLRALRTQHGVSIRAVRDALDYVDKNLGEKWLLASQELRTRGGDLLLDKYVQLINLNRSGQLVMRRLLADHLGRVEWDLSNIPLRLYPFVTSDLPGGRTIAIDPHISFGRPIVVRKGISTAVIAERIDVGEAVEDLALDYGLEKEEVEAALLYERSA